MMNLNVLLGGRPSALQISYVNILFCFCLLIMKQYNLTIIPGNVTYPIGTASLVASSFSLLTGLVRRRICTSRRCRLRWSCVTTKLLARRRCRYHDYGDNRFNAYRITPAGSISNPLTCYNTCFETKYCQGCLPDVPY